MIRVLQIFGKLGRGGLETFVMNLYRNIDRGKIQFDFLLTYPDGDYEAEAVSLGAKIYHIPPRGAGLKKYRAALELFFKEHAAEYTAVHLHASSLTSIEPLIYAKRHGISRRIIHSHSSSVKQNLKLRLAHQLVHSFNKLKIRFIATDYLGCSDKALDWMYKGSGVRSKAVMVNNGINTSDFAFDETARKELRTELGVTDKFVIGHVGSFIHVKNHRFLINLFAETLKAVPDAILVLVGDGELRGNIQRQIDNLNIGDKVVLTGTRSDVNRILQAFDLLIMPSLFEGLPVSLVEAQASGLPVLASDTISHDVAITPNIKFLSLESAPDKWINHIVETHNNFKRKDTSSFIIENGFDIQCIVNLINRIYMS